MRKKLLTLLRELESQSGFRNEYTNLDDSLDCTYTMDEYINFPDFRFLLKHLNERNVVTRDGIIIPFSTNSVTAELRRMEADGLIMIGTQTGIRYGSVFAGNGPEIENAAFTTESVVLSTQGKSRWRYFEHKFWENPVAATLSLIAIAISIITLFVKANFPTP